ncbi:MAG: glycerate kinase, partial [Desulfurococcaceae archaeon]
VEDTLKPGHPLFNGGENHIVLSNQMVLQKLQEALASTGYNTLLLTSMLEGEAKEVGKALASIIKNISVYGRPINKPAALLAEGETVVTVKGKGVGKQSKKTEIRLHT